MKNTDNGPDQKAPPRQAGPIPAPGGPPAPGPGAAPGAARPACPVCGGPLVERRGKLICSRCRTICETCCEGGRG